MASDVLRLMAVVIALMQGGAVGAQSKAVPGAVPTIPSNPATIERADGRAEWRLPGQTLAPVEQAADAPVRDATPSARAVGNSPPDLGPIGPQRLSVGRPWQLHFRVRDRDGDDPLVEIDGLPDGAVFTPGDNGWHLLDWTPTPAAAAAGVLDLTIVAVDARDRRIRSERVVRLEIGAVPLADAGASGSNSSTSSRGADSPVRASAPVFEPIAAQIVSTGRTVAFRVAAALADADAVPVLQIDRLPRNASFDVDDDGSRTFYWPTGAGDEGEHRFRLTASHPDDAALRSRVDLLVIVGDPSRASTAPADEPAVAGDGASMPAIASQPDDDARAASLAGPSSPASPASPASPSSPSSLARPVNSVDPAASASPVNPVDPVSPVRADLSAPADPVATGSDVPDEPFLPQAGPEAPDYWSSEEGGADGSTADAWPEGADPAYLAPDEPAVETSAPGYFADGGGTPLGPDGQPIDP